MQTSEEPGLCTFALDLPYFVIWRKNLKIKLNSDRVRNEAHLKPQLKFQTWLKYYTSVGFSGFNTSQTDNARHLCQVTSTEIPCYAFLFEGTILRSPSSQVFTPSLLSQQCDKESC